MIEFTKFGITMSQVKEEDLEMLRDWRNSDFVAKNMVYQEYITPEMQQNWFKKINDGNNYFFIMKADGANVGLAHIKDINWDERTGEGGLSLASDEYAASDYAARGTIAYLDYAFSEMELSKTYQTVLHTNKNALNILKFLGCKPYEETDTYVRTYLDKDTYIQKTQKVRSILSKNYE